MIRVLLMGVGRMGKEITRQLASEDDMKIVAAIASPTSAALGKDLGLCAGIGELGVKIESCKRLAEVIRKERPEVAVDFSTPDACFRNSIAACEQGLDLVIGTTGLSEEQLKAIEKAVKRNRRAAVISPNMSIGVNVFWKLVEEAASLLRGYDYDVEVVEAHHRFKLDAPSGTAIRAVEAVERGFGRKLQCIYGRKGYAKRGFEEVGVHALRAGDIVGDHIVLFSTLGERLELVHRAHSRAAFAKGVVAAIRFVRGKQGVFSMTDVLGL